MQLPNFLDYGPFNYLRHKMNAELIDFGKIKMESLNVSNLRKRLRERGIDVDIKKVKVDEDGTLLYEGEKVLIYIRDQYLGYIDSGREYKYHISNCRTLQEMRKKNRYYRYVASTRTDGKFIVNYIGYNNEIVEKEKLTEIHVCRGCLRNLNYKGYADAPGWKKNEIYENFSLEEFFKMYGANSNNFDVIPAQTDISAQEYVYPADKILYKKIKLQHGYTCEKCGRKFSAFPEFLSIHHIDGNITNNNPDNLKVLCLGCHAEEPGHHRMKNSQEYQKFKRLYG